ncbi:MAG: radical SAM protein [Muribaculaceae bacterium]|nr:radical SAM protein [Muribaculaceae bacterium]
MTTSYTDLQHLFEQRKKNPLFNTSYPLSPDDWAKYSTPGTLPFDSSGPIAFYIHIPFCSQICSFCEYTKMRVPSRDLQINYLNALGNQIERFIEQHPEMKIYGFDIGGGTPTSLDLFPGFMMWIREFLESQTFTFNFEPSIEGSFDTLVDDYLGQHKSFYIAKAGFKRLSLGVQSTSNTVLTPLHRNNISAAKMGKAIDEWHRLGISKINLDLMYGLPGQTLENIKKDIDIIRELNPEQVTVYEFRTNQLKTKYKPDSDICFNQYCELFDGLSRLGYFGEFGRNTFSRDRYDLGLSSYLRHRMFDGWQYKGFGISAQSMSPFGVSYNIGKNEAIEKLIDQNWLIKNGSTYEASTYYQLPRHEILNKFIAISGYSGGFSLAAAKNIFGNEFDTRYSTVIRFLRNENLATIKGDRLQLTETGFRHYGTALSLFY